MNVGHHRIGFPHVTQCEVFGLIELLQKLQAYRGSPSNVIFLVDLGRESSNGATSPARLGCTGCDSFGCGAHCLQHLVNADQQFDLQTSFRQREQRCRGEWGVQPHLSQRSFIKPSPIQLR